MLIEINEHIRYGIHLIQSEIYNIIKKPKKKKKRSGIGLNKKRRKGKNKNCVIYGVSELQKLCWIE